MLRNNLIAALSERDNDPVTVSVNGFLIDIASVSYLGGHIVLILDPEEMGDVLELIVAGDPGPGVIPPGH